MSNKLKWSDWGSTELLRHDPGVGKVPRRSPWPPFLGCLAGLAILATLLPGPAAWAPALTGDPANSRAGAQIGSTAETALLLAAGVIVWLLLAWGVTVGVVAALGHLPGAPGQLGRAVLRRIAPASAGRLVAATLGVTLLAGTTGCSAPALAGSEVTTASPSSSALTTVLDSPAAGTTQDVPSIDIDWPLTADPASLSPATGSPTGSSSPPTTPPHVDPELTGPVQTSPQPTISTSSPTDPGAGGLSGDHSSPQPAPEPAEPATDPPPAEGPATEPSPAAGPDPGSTPTGTPGSADVPSSDGPNSDGRVKVQPGDTLWSIAAAALPASATSSDIDSAWRAWHLTNRQVVGDDPDVIKPGQSLLPPTITVEHSP